MPKCSCSGNSCSCAVQVGDGLTLTGTGNSGAPFTIALASQLVTVTHAAAGAVDLSAAKSGTVVVVGLSAAVTGIILPPSPGARIDLVFRQVTAGNAVAFGTAVKWPGGTNPTVSSTINYLDWFVLRALSATEWIGATEGLAIR